MSKLDINAWYWIFSKKVNKSSFLFAITFYNIIIHLHDNYIKETKADTGCAYV